MSDTRSAEMASSTADSSDVPSKNLRVKTADSFATGIPAQKSPVSTSSSSANTPPHSEASGGGSNNAVPGAQKTQAAFISKLYNMVEDPNIQNLIGWAPSGDVFSVSNPTDFSKIVLPQYFKHNNWQSFVRQLNMYGFHKVNDMFHANPTSETQAWEFKHPDFRRGDLVALQNIKRKSSRPSHANSERKSLAAIPSNAIPMHQSENLPPPPLVEPPSREDRVEMLHRQVAEMDYIIRQMSDSYKSLFQDFMATRSLQSRQLQAMSNMTQLLTSFCLDDDRSEHTNRKRKFEAEVLQSEMSKLMQADNPSTYYYGRPPGQQFPSGQPPLPGKTSGRSPISENHYIPPQGMPSYPPQYATYKYSSPQAINGIPPHPTSYHSYGPDPSYSRRSPERTVSYIPANPQMSYSGGAPLMNVQPQNRDDDPRLRPLNIPPQHVVGPPAPRSPFRTQHLQGSGLPDVRMHDASSSEGAESNSSLPMQSSATSSQLGRTDSARKKRRSNISH